METFKKIENFENYSISDFGRVRNDKTGKFLKPYQKENGYLQIQMGRKTMPQYVHRLVAKAFIPNDEEKPQVNHKNGDKTNNTISNLEWVTASENSLSHGYKERIENRKKKIIATNLSGDKIIFNSRNDVAIYFKCDKSQVSYGRVYKKGNKKGWKFELMI